MNLPKWIKQSLRNIASDNDYEANRLGNAISIAIEALEEQALPGYADSDYKSLHETLRVRALTVLARIEKMGDA
jgi:hypothetical protein